MEYKILSTTDGSKTLQTSLFNASYHSLHGALEESNVVFLQLGIQYFVDKGYSDIRLFEMGFGTGLNAALSIQFARAHKVNLQYEGVEAYPVPIEVIDQIGYQQLFTPPHDDIYLRLHKSSWNTKHDFGGGVYFTKNHILLEQFETQNKFDLVYFDAFAPECQPELWSEESLAKIYNLLDNNGVLTTYCAKGSFKRTLKSLGFSVESHPGPGRKREITRAIKKRD